MPRLVLVRHARASHAAASDLLRPLTEDGVRQALDVGRRLRDFEPLGPVACSPAVRCLQTAAAVLEGLEREEPPRVLHELSESSDGLEIWTALKALGDEAVAVAHQPGLAELASRLLGGRVAPPLAPGTALVFERAGTTGTWTLARVIVPA